MLTPPRLLLIEDSVNDADLLIRHLTQNGVVPVYERVETESALTSALEEKEWDTAICDYNLPQLNALNAIHILKMKKPDLPCIVVSGAVGEERAVETMRAGASDYIMKDNLTRLVPVLHRELKEASVRKEQRQIQDALRKSEENLRQAQKLESIGQLAGGIAHDFNNLLATILLQSDVLMDGFDKTLSMDQLFEHVSKGVEQIKKSGVRATNLTRQLLAFSRKQVMMSKVVNLNTLIFDMEKMLVRVIETNIEFKTSLAHDLKNIKIDPGHLEQILVNLVVNSRDAMPDGGKLKIETQNSHVDEVTAKSCNAEPGPYVLLTITDSGTGMSEDVKGHLFEPFFTTKPVGKGTGLGLCTIYGIVKQNKGLIFVESEIGKGTCFKLFFPMTSEAVPSVNLPKKEISTVKSTGTILVVEDEEDLKELICETLRSHGYQVLAASNGAEALLHINARKTAIHLIVTDIVMPQMGGSELAKQAQVIDGNIQILFQSGYTEDLLIQNGIHSGKIHFLSKPYPLKTLIEKVREILAQNRLINKVNFEN